MAYLRRNGVTKWIDDCEESVEMNEVPGTGMVKPVASERKRVADIHKTSLKGHEGLQVQLDKELDRIAKKDNARMKVGRISEQECPLDLREEYEGEDTSAVGRLKLLTMRKMHNLGVKESSSLKKDLIEITQEIALEMAALDRKSKRANTLLKGFLRELEEAMEED